MESWRIGSLLQRLTKHCSGQAAECGVKTHANADRRILGASLKYTGRVLRREGTDEL